MRRRSFLRGVVVASVGVFSAGCGFQLRGSYTLPYESLFFAGGDGSVIVAGVKRAIRGAGTTRLTEEAAEAQATFLPSGEARIPIVLSLSSSGRVREKRLRYVYGYRIVDAKGRDLVAPVQVEVFRDITYADSAVLAKTQEEDLLWRDMESDLVQQILRRLSAMKPVFPAADQ